MRKRIFTLVAGLIVSCLSASAPAQAYEGCLGAEVRACLTAIAPHVTPIDMAAAQRAIDRFLAGDIAGRRKAKSSVSVSYRSNFSDPLDPLQQQLMMLDFSASLAISQIEISLRPGAANAETDADYRATHIYETALFALGSRPDCATLANAHDFYVFFHTQVRPKLRAAKVERGIGEFRPASDFSGDTGWIRLCGRQMKMAISSAEWGGVQANMDRKYSAHMTSLAFR